MLSLRLNEDDNDEERGRETIAQAPSPIRDLDYRRDHDVLAVATDEGCVIYPVARDEDSEPIFVSDIDDTTRFMLTSRANSDSIAAPVEKRLIPP